MLLLGFGTWPRFMEARPWLATVAAWANLRGQPCRQLLIRFTTGPGHNRTWTAKGIAGAPASSTAFPSMWLSQKCRLLKVPANLHGIPSAPLIRSSYRPNDPSSPRCKSSIKPTPASAYIPKPVRPWRLLVITYSTNLAAIDLVGLAHFEQEMKR